MRENEGRSHGHERHAWSTACGRSRRAALPSDPRSGQTGGSFRGPLPDHRYHSLQLHKFRPAQGIHPHPVQGALSQPPRARGWTGIVAQELGEFFELLPPMQRTGANWYMGTADAVYQNIYSIGSEQPKYMIILSADHIYKMDYSRMLEYHKETKAECTLAVLPISPDEVSRYGVVEVGANGE